MSWRLIDCRYGRFDIAATWRLADLKDNSGVFQPSTFRPKVGINCRVKVYFGLIKRTTYNTLFNGLQGYMKADLPLGRSHASCFCLFPGAGCSFTSYQSAACFLKRRTYAQRETKNLLASSSSITSRVFVWVQRSRPVPGIKMWLLCRENTPTCFLS